MMSAVGFLVGLIASGNDVAAKFSWFGILDSNLVIIDDLMFMAMDSREANLFFHLINDLYDNASVILTSNRAE